MQRFRPILLEVWREIARRPSLAESAGALAGLVARRLPIGRLVLRRIDRAPPGIESVASASPDSGPVEAPDRVALAPGQLEAVLAWAAAGRPAHARTRVLEGRLPGVLAPGAVGDAIATPLMGVDGPAGVLVLVARRGESFGTEHLALAAALAEPLGAALEHEKRVRELEVQNAAAEADRLSLLSRLGRSDLGEVIVGAGGGLRAVFERVDRVAASDVPVLLLGETGSGKEVVARAIHQRSRRAGAAFHRVNCGAIPGGLVDSELFGHERGSFTGATGLRKGWFERADGGTLFLDEVGELPPAAQVRLLRVLQDGSFERVGGQHTLSADVRIVAATHRDLRAMVETGSFREDLWYRLAVFPIELPPLRERPEDLPELATHFALRAATRFGVPPRLPTRADLDQLLDYAWPGNVRELGAVIERAVILGSGDRLDVGAALGRTAAPAPRPVEQPAAPAPPRAGPAGRFATLDEAMRAHIESALERTRGRIEGAHGAAALLAINPHTLRARMRKLRIDWGRFRS